MKTKRTFLHSKLARRILWLFILSAMIPMTLLAVISLRNVTDQLKEQNRLLLHQVSRDEAMSIIERMRFLEADMDLAASSIRDSRGKFSAHSLGASIGLSSNLVNRFNGLKLVAPDGNCRSFFGDCDPRIEYTVGEHETLRSGKVVFSVLECKRPAPCIFISRELDAAHPNEGILAANIQDSYLWGAENLRQDIDLCVLDQLSRTLFCSAESPSTFPAQVARTNSGEFEWKRNGQEYLADFWKLPLTASLSTAHRSEEHTSE